MKGSSRGQKPPRPCSRAGEEAEEAKPGLLCGKASKCVLPSNPGACILRERQIQGGFLTLVLWCPGVQFSKGSTEQGWSHEKLWAQTV